jgi:hypothetical protein
MRTSGCRRLHIKGCFRRRGRVRGTSCSPGASGLPSRALYASVPSFFAAMDIYSECTIQARVRVDPKTATDCSPDRSRADEQRDCAELKSFRANSKEPHPWNHASSRRRRSVAGDRRDTALGCFPIISTSCGPQAHRFKVCMFPSYLSRVRIFFDATASLNTAAPLPDSITCVTTCHECSRLEGDGDSLGEQCNPLYRVHHGIGGGFDHRY